MSAVVYDPKYDKAPDGFTHLTKRAGTHILVRARVKEDLEDLRPVCRDLRVSYDARADYKFRTVISRRQWQKYINRCIREMDYGSHFKEVVEKNALPKSLASRRHSAMMRCWTAMAELTWDKPSYSKPKSKSSKYVPATTPVASFDKAWPTQSVTAEPPEFSDFGRALQTLTPRYLLERLLELGSTEKLPSTEVFSLDDDAYEALQRIKHEYGNMPLTEAMIKDVLSDMDAEGLLAESKNDDRKS